MIPKYDANYLLFPSSRLEDSIIFYFIERLQFAFNRPIYVPGGVVIPNSDLPLMDWLLRETERLHSRVRRYQSPDEYPFFPDVLEEPILKPLKYPDLLHPNDVNVNDVIKSRYVNEILPHACMKHDRGEDPDEDRGEQQENYGSAATCDVSCLQALSRRVHFGKFVAESKFLTDTDKFVKLIKANDRAGIEAAITDAAVEEAVLNRLRLKAKTYGTDPSKGSNGPSKVDADGIADMYKVSVDSSYHFWFIALSECYC